jgi:hypothetical protein
MPQTCSMCIHPQCAGIHEALRQGDSIQVVAKRDGTSKASIHRHKQHSGFSAERHALLAEAQALHEATLRARDLPGLMQVTRRLAQLVVLLCRQDD